IESPKLFENASALGERGSCAGEIVLRASKGGLAHQRLGQLVPRAAAAQRVHGFGEVLGRRRRLVVQQAFSKQPVRDGFQVSISNLATPRQDVVADAPGELPLALPEMRFTEPQHELRASESEIGPRVPVQDILELGDSLVEAAFLDESIRANASQRGGI